MKYFISVLLFIISFSINAQTWVQSGATWKYEYTDESFPWIDTTPFTHNYSEDTLIDGKLCQKFTLTRYQIEETTMDSTVQTIGFTYANSDTIFYKHHDRFFVLFNFGAEVGDSWIISDSIEDDVFSNSICGDTSTVTVTNTGIVDYDGNSYRTITIETEPNSPYYLEGTFIERFGVLNNFNEYTQHTLIFPKADIDHCEEGLIVDWVSSGFDCYYDDNFSFNPSDGCGFYLNTDKKNEIPTLSISPNPTHSSLQIKSSINNGTFKIIDAFGKIVSVGKIDNNLCLADVSNLSNGVYFITITNQLNQSQNLKFIKN
jgi:hypothetical protein